MVTHGNDSSVTRGNDKEGQTGNIELQHQYGNQFEYTATRLDMDLRSMEIFEAEEFDLRGVPLAIDAETRLEILQRFSAGRYNDGPFKEHYAGLIYQSNQEGPASAFQREVHELNGSTIREPYNDGEVSSLSAYMGLRYGHQHELARSENVSAIAYHAFGAEVIGRLWSVYKWDFFPNPELAESVYPDQGPLDRSNLNYRAGVLVGFWKPDGVYALAPLEVAANIDFAINMSGNCDISASISLEYNHLPSGCSARIEARFPVLESHPFSDNDPYVLISLIF